jgi:hypothetical protein
MAVGAVLIGAYYLLPPDAQSIAYVVIGALAVIGVVVGTIINLAPGQRLAWWLFAGGLVPGGRDAVFAVYEVGLDREPPLPSVADAFYLAGYPLLAVGAFLLVRRVAGPFTQAAALDAVIVFLAVALVQWVFFIDQYNHEHLDTGARLTAMAYPAMDALLLTAIGQLLTVRGVRSTAYRLLVLSLSSGWSPTRRTPSGLPATAGAVGSTPYGSARTSAGPRRHSTRPSAGSSSRAVRRRHV